MLTTRHRTAATTSLLFTGLAMALSAAAAPLNPGVSAGQRPPDLVMLEERITHDGAVAIGVFAARRDPLQEDVWRVRVWRETAASIDVSTDMVGCSRTAPMRITEHGERLVLRQLNPGGLITSVNRLDHLIWWAVCAPGQAGRDPADLAATARELGYDGNLPEREQLLPVRTTRPR